MKRIVALAGLVLLAGVSARGEQSPPAELTLEDALERARQSAPAVVAARMRIEEARARLRGASLPLPTNPTVAVEGGRRRGGTPTSDYGVEVGQDLEPSSRRRARMDAARAGVTGEEQRAREAEGEAMRDVATTFLRALEARERAGAADGARRLAGEALQIAERRFAAGDVAQLDVNLARTAVAGAAGEARVANAALAGHLTRLRVLLGMAGPVMVAGSLRDGPAFTAGDLVARAADRPDVRVLEAEIAAAEAERRLAGTLRWPDFGVRASYASEEGDRIVLAGAGLTIPLFQRGQEAVAVANARVARLRWEREALMRTVEADVLGAVATHAALAAAASEVERTVLPLLEENEKLALESYDAGQIGLSELLLVRREALDARRVFVDRLVETRLAEVELRARTGVWK